MGWLIDQIKHIDLVCFSVCTMSTPSTDIFAVQMCCSILRQARMWRKQITPGLSLRQKNCQKNEIYWEEREGHIYSHHPLNIVHMLYVPHGILAWGNIQQQYVAVTHMQNKQQQTLTPCLSVGEKLPNRIISFSIIFMWDICCCWQIANEMYHLILFCL